MWWRKSKNLSEKELTSNVGSFFISYEILDYYVQFVQKKEINVGFCGKLLTSNLSIVILFLVVDDRRNWKEGLCGNNVGKETGNDKSISKKASED